MPADLHVVSGRVEGEGGGGVVTGSGGKVSFLPVSIKTLSTAYNYTKGGQKVRLSWADSIP